MDAEVASDFLAGLFAEMRLAPRSSDPSVRCQLYVPHRFDEPVSTDILLSEDEAKDNEQTAHARWVKGFWYTLQSL